MSLIRNYIKYFAFVMMFIAVGTNAQVTPTAYGAFLGSGNPTVWNPWTSASSLGALAVTPPAIALYCQALPPLGPWTPCNPSGGGGGGITALTGDVTASGSGSVAAIVNGINIANVGVLGQASLVRSGAGYAIVGSAIGGPMQILTVEDSTENPLFSVNSEGTVFFNTPDGYSLLAINGNTHSVSTGSGTVLDDGTGNALFAGTIKSGGVFVCLQNGTDCPAATAPSFSAITTGTNTTATMTVGSGASLSTSGTGTIIATGLSGGSSSANINTANAEILADSIASTPANGYIAFGDSISTFNGFGATTGYPTLIGNDIGVTPNNQAIGGDTAGDMSWHILTTLNPTDTGNPIVTAMAGINDAITYGAPALTTYTKYQYASASWSSMSSTNKILAGNASVTKSGTWTADTTWLNANGQTSSTATNTLSYPAQIGPSGVFYIRYKMTATAGAFTVTVGGSSVTDTVGGVSPVTTIWTADPNTHQAAAIGMARFVAAPGSRSIVITVSSGTVTILDFSFPPVTRYRGISAPRYFFGGITQEGGGTNGAIISTFNAASLAVSKQLVADGLFTSFVDTNNALDTNLDFVSSTTQNCPAGTATPLHPNQCGQQHLAQVFEAAINAVSAGSSTPSFAAITSATNTTATMICGTGCVLTASGTGNISATNLSNSVVVNDVTAGANGTINFGLNYDNPAICLYGPTNCATGSNFGWGLGLSTMEFFIPSSAGYGWCFSYGGAIDNTNASCAEYLTYQGHLSVPSFGGYLFSSTASGGGAIDTGISRSSAGVIQADTTTLGNGLGTYKATNFIDTGLISASIVATDGTGKLIAGSGSTAAIAFPATVSGTVVSGGIPYFSSTTSEASSALLVANSLMIGGGAGVAPLTSPFFAAFTSVMMGTVNTLSLTYSSGLDGNYNAALGSSTLRGANQSGAGGAASAGGNAILKGGDNAGTNAASEAGSTEVTSGQSTAGGLQGLTLITSSFVKGGGTSTKWNLQCLTSQMTVNDCAATPNNIIGVAAIVNTTTVQVHRLASQTPVNASAAVTIGDTVCAGATAGSVTDSGGTGPCTVGFTVGYVEAISGTYNLPVSGSFTLSSTLPLIEIDKTVGAPSLVIEGVATLSSGTVTVSSTASCTPSTTCAYKLSNCGLNGTTAVGVLGVGTIVPGTSFVIDSYTSLAAISVDTSKVCWAIVP